VLTVLPTLTKRKIGSNQLILQTNSDGVEALARVMVEAESEEGNQKRRSKPRRLPMGPRSAASMATNTAGFGQMGSSPQIREQQRPDPRPEADRPARREGRVIPRDGTALHETAGPPDKLGPECKGCNWKQISFGEMSRLSDAFHITG
jgi:hypothetical protein